MKIQILLMVSGLTLAVACGGANDTMSRAKKVETAVQATKVTPSSSPEHQMPDALEQATTDLNIGSIEDIRAAAVRVQDARPRFYDAMMAMEPVRTRNNMLRFTNPELHDADAAPVFALRLLDDQAEKDMRLALVDAIARTMGSYGQYLAVLTPAESDAEVRSLLIDQLKRADLDSARAGIEFGLKDAEPVVRQAALRALATQSELQVELLSEGIVTALDDNDAEVREAAAFAARVRGERVALDRLVAVAQQDHSDARIQALRAIEAIDSSYLDQLDLATLAQDDDQRVARFASRTIATR